MKTRFLFILLLLMSLTAGSTLGNDVVDITEWRVPWENTKPRDPFVDSRNRVWFVGQTGDYIAHFAPRPASSNALTWSRGPAPTTWWLTRTGRSGSRAI